MESSCEETENINAINPIPCQDVQVNKWSDPPKDVLLSILRFLSFKTDLPRLRGVCTSWRSLLPESADILKTFPTEFPQLPNKPSLSLVESRFFLMYPLLSGQEADDADSITHTPAATTASRWLIKMIESWPTNWYITNPLNLQELFITHPTVEGTINLCDCRVLELCSAYSLVDGMYSEAKVVSEKVMVIPNFDSEVEYYFTVLAILDGRLFFWRTGDKEWTDIGGSNCKFVDAVSHHGKFFAYDLTIKKLVVIDPATSMVTNSPQLKYISGPPLLDELLNRDSKFYGLHLVIGSNGLLYLLIRVRKPIDKCFTMVVFLLKEEEPMESTDVNDIWESVKSLGDQIFFLGTDASFSLPSPVEHLPQWKPGTICLFLKTASLVMADMMRLKRKGTECLEIFNCPEYFQYFQLFDLENESMIPFQELPKQEYTGLFFPPPPWVKWHCPSRNNAEVRFDNVHFSFQDYNFFFDSFDSDYDDGIESDLDEEDWDLHDSDDEE